MASLSDVNAILAWHFSSNLKDDASNKIKEEERARSGEQCSASTNDNCDMNSFVTDSSLITQLRMFSEQNKAPNTSPNLQNDTTDDVHLLIDATSRLVRIRTGNEDGEVHESDVITLAKLCCTVLKILSRKQCNRKCFGKDGVIVTIDLLRRFSQNIVNEVETDEVDGKVIENQLSHHISQSSSVVCGEAANVVLNICYEKANVECFLEGEGVAQLLTLMKQDNIELRANAAGAIQSICYQKSGRRSVVATGGVPILLNLLDTDDDKLLSRSIGALHNMSSDTEAIKIIRRSQGIEKIIHLLNFELETDKAGGDSCTANDSSSEVRKESLRNSIVSSAAGTLQNLCREVASRDVVSEHEYAVPSLVRILFGEDVHAQVCAAGALINIIGPELERNDEDKNNYLATMRKATSSSRRPLRRTSEAGFYPIHKVRKDGLQDQPTRDSKGDISGHHNDRRGFSRLLKCCLTVGMLHAAIFDFSPSCTPHRLYV